MVTIMMIDNLWYIGAIVSTSFWVLIWIMHLCAITNAKLKLNKKTYATYRPSTTIQHDIKQLPHINNNARTIIIINNNNNNNNNINQQRLYESSHQQHNDNTHKYSYINLPLPGVSIIKPLVGLDKNLTRNLETFFRMDYPTYEILFCVQDSHDEAITIVEELFKRYPYSDAKLFIGGSQVGVNPKINNMQPAYESTKYELILISDSGISMKPDTLLDMVAHMHDNVALVHQMPFVLSPPNYDDNNDNDQNNNMATDNNSSHHYDHHHHHHHNNNNERKNFNNNNNCIERRTMGKTRKNSYNKSNFQSVLERVYFGTAHARAYLTADLLNINCPTGMSALMRKCLLDEVGGIKAFGSYLAEDYFFAKSFTDRGWKISISSQPAQQNSANSCDIMILSSRIQRWIKLRFAMVPQWTLLEPLSECMLLGVIGAISISFLWALNAYVIFTLHVLIWLMFDYKLLSTIQNGPMTFSKTYFLIAWFLRECSAPIIFILALIDPKVTWRSRKFRLKWGGYAEEVVSPSTIDDNKQQDNQFLKTINSNKTIIYSTNNGLLSKQFKNDYDDISKDACSGSMAEAAVTPNTTISDQQIKSPAHYLGYNCMYMPFFDLVN